MNGLESDAVHSLIRRLKALADCLPSDSAAVTLTRADLRQLLADHGEVAGDNQQAGRPTADYTVEDVAEALDRSPSTVRGWLSTGVLRGYKFRGREWRIPPAAFREFQEREAAGDLRPNGRELLNEEDVDLGAWRRHYRQNPRQ